MVPIKNVISRIIESGCMRSSTPDPRAETLLADLKGQVTIALERHEYYVRYANSSFFFFSPKSSNFFLDGDNIIYFLLLEHIYYKFAVILKILACKLMEDLCLRP